MLTNNQAPVDFLKRLAQGDLGSFIKENKNFTIISGVTKIRNGVLRSFVEQEHKNNIDYKILLDVLLNIDAAIEQNNVKDMLKQFANE